MNTSAWAAEWLNLRYAQAVLGRRVTRHSTRAKVEQHLRDWILPTIGTRQLARLTLADCQRCLRARQGSPATRNRVRSTLRALMADAVRMGHLERSPAEGLQRLLEEAKPKAVAKHEAWPELLADLPPDSRRAAALMLYAGLRLSEALGLRWGQVDLEARRLRFGTEVKERRAKVVPYPAVLAPYMGQRGMPGARVCAGVSERTVRRHLAVHGLTPHGLRHSCATALSEAGQPVQTIGALLGHSNVSTTQRYIHTDDDALAGAVDALDHSPAMRRVS